MMGPGPMPGPPGPLGPGPRNFGPPGHGMRPRMDMPRMDVPPDLRDGPLPGQMYSEGYGSRIDSPKFDGLGSRIDQGLTNDFAALNLQIPGSGLKVYFMADFIYAACYIFVFNNGSSQMILIGK